MTSVLVSLSRELGALGALGALEDMSRIDDAFVDANARRWLQDWNWIAENRSIGSGLKPFKRERKAR